MRSATARALIRFHRAAGARVALRANGIVGATVVFLFGVSAPAPDPLATLRATLLGVVASDHPWGARGILAAFCVALAAVAAPRVTLGTTGWMCSLAASVAEHRRAAIVALFMAQALALIFVAISMLVVAQVYHSALSVSKVVSVPGVMLAAALLVLPVGRGLVRVFSAFALALFIPGTWALSAIGVVVLVIADTLSGEIVRRRRRKSRSLAALVMTAGGGHHERSEGSASSRRSALLASVRLTWRTLSLTTILGGIAIPALFIAFAQLIVRRNPDLPVAAMDRTIRICGSLALAGLVASFGNALVTGRPPWSWSRSLPWSSRDRVIGDAIALGIPTLLVPLALVSVGKLAALSIAAMIPPIAIVTAAALRVGAGRQTGAAGEAVAFTVIIGAFVVVWPLASIAILAVSPLLVRWAARRERDVVTSRWLELQHHAIGDPRWLDTP